MTVAKQRLMIVTSKQLLETDMGIRPSGMLISGKSENGHYKSSPQCASMSGLDG